MTRTGLKNQEAPSQGFEAFRLTFQAPSLLLVLTHFLCFLHSGQGCTDSWSRSPDVPEGCDLPGPCPH